MRKAHEAWLDSIKQEVVPYLIFSGPLDSVRAFVCLNEHLYPFDNPVEAVQSLYQVLTALSAFPSIREFAWGFIHKAVYGFDFDSIPSKVRTLIENLK